LVGRHPSDNDAAYAQVPQQEVKWRCEECRVLGLIAPGAKASASGKSQVLNMSTTSSAVAPAARSSASGAFEGSEGMC